MTALNYKDLRLNLMMGVIIGCLDKDSVAGYRLLKFTVARKMPEFITLFDEALNEAGVLGYVVGSPIEGFHLR